MLDLTIWLAIGLGAGWFARWVLAGGRDYGLIGDLTTGCLGAVVGGWLMRKFQVIAPDNLLGHVFTALVGAVALLIIIRRLRQTLPAVAMITAARGGLHGLELEARLRQLTEFERGLLARFFVRASAVAVPEKEFDSQRGIGDRIADKVASFGGSWTFIGLFFVAMFSWMAVNEELTRPLDPFPFILLNLMLSCLAAMQAPIIMMSQNRQAAKDRLDVRNDYEVNLRAEIEIMALHAKIDAALTEELVQIASRQQQQAAQLSRLELYLHGRDDDRSTACAATSTSATGRGAIDGV